jgi:hypothetical protein
MNQTAADQRRKGLRQPDKTAVRSGHPHRSDRRASALALSLWTSEHLAATGSVEEERSRPSRLLLVHSECVDYRPETLATTRMEKRRPREVSLVLGPVILTHSLWRDSDVFSRSPRLWPAQLDTAANSVAAGEGRA